MPVINKDLIIPFIVGEKEKEEETLKPKEVVFDFGSPGEEKIEEDWFIRNYDLYDTNGTAEEKALVKDQRHVDIRTFAGGSGEKWSLGTPELQEVMGKLPGLTLPLTTGEIVTSSVASNLDLNSEFTPQDYIILALPSFPLSSITTAESFLDLTSHPEGNFTTGPTVSIKFSESTSTLEAGNSEFRILRSLIEKNNLNLSEITGIRFRIKATGTATLILAGLRLVSKNWGYAPIDFDNWNGRWVLPVPPNGSLSHAKTFTSQPVLWRSTDPSSEEDPQIIDASLGALFYTGSQTAINSLSVYLRETTQAFLTQIDLDGKKMEELDHHPQPDYGLSRFSPRQIGGLDSLKIGELDKRPVDDLERIENALDQRWISFRVNWGTNDAIIISNSTEESYDFVHPAFANNTYYLAIILLEGTTARLSIYQLNPDFTINPKAFWDSTLIKDGGIFKRHQGRVGWKANLEDGDAFVEAIQPRGLTFAEFVSSPLKSRTPVKGANLFANFTPNVEMFMALTPFISDEVSTTLTRDSAKALSSSSWRITNNGGTGQAVQSNTFSLTDPSQIEFSFDLWHPSNLPALTVKLVNSQGAIVPLTLPFLYRDQWQKISLKLSESLIPTGKFILVFEQPQAGVGTYWLDNISISQRSIQWSARAIADDPWESNDAPWTDFRDIVNGKGGVQFSAPGKELQFRAKARQQMATIAGPPQIKPVYAQLGRLVWPEEALAATGPTAEFTASHSSPEVISELIKFPEKPNIERGDLATSASFAYWTEETKGGEPNEEEEEGSIKRGPIGGGAATTLIPATEANPFEPLAIAIDATFIYFTYRKFIARAKLDGTSLESHWSTIEGGELVRLKSLAVDNTYVYCTTASQILRIPKATPTTKEVLIAGLTKPKGLNVNASSLFWINNKNTIETDKLGKDVLGTGKKVLYSTPSTLVGLGINSSGLFWSFDSIANTSGIGTINLDGSELIEEFVEGSGPEAGGIEATSSYVYWVNGEAIGRATLGNNPLEVNYASTSTPGTAPISLYEWDLGDGTIALGPKVSHTYLVKGTYFITLTVVDSLGLRNSHGKSVTVA